MEKNKVKLYIYDLSMGLAKNVAPLLIGKPLEGIWHTSIVVYNKEYLFNSNGVEHCIPGSTQLHQPLRVEDLGETEVPEDVFNEFIANLAETTFAAPTYNIFQHNCNNFSEEVAQFLVGKSIPKYILDLPNEVLSSNLTPAILSLLQNIERGAHVNRSGPTTAREESSKSQQDQNGFAGKNKEGSPEYQQLNNEIDEARYNSFLLQLRRNRTREKLLKRERKKRKRLHTDISSNINMADAEMVNGNNETEQIVITDEQIRAAEDDESKDEEPKWREPPIVYKDLIDIKNEFDALINLIDGKISADEQRCMEELSVYMLEEEGSWALSDDFLTFVGRLLNDSTFNSEVRIRIVNILAVAALKDDVILVLHQDRREHVLMNYAYGIDKIPLDEQKALSLFVANLFEHLAPSEWLLYISEWNFNGQQTSNIRVTTKVGVHCLLSDDAILQDRGAAIIHNLAIKEKMFKNIRIRQLLPRGALSKVFDDVAVELTMAVLQYFNSKPSEEQLFRCMKALAKFVELSRNEVPQLIQMIGPEPKSFKGTSPRIDEFIEKISVKLR